MTDPRMTPPNDAPVTVEQCDREAAYLYWLFTRSLDEADYRAKLMQTEFEKGARDEQETVQAFARHRLAALASAPAGDGVEAIATIINDGFGDPKHDKPSAAAQAWQNALGKARQIAALARPRAAVETVDCERCCGNGEIVTDWDRYKHPHDGDKGDEAVADCPDCGGTGKVDSPRAAVGEREATGMRPWGLALTDADLTRLRDQSKRDIPAAGSEVRQLVGEVEWYRANTPATPAGNEAGEREA